MMTEGIQKKEKEEKRRKENTTFQKMVIDQIIILAMNVACVPEKNRTLSVVRHEGGDHFYLSCPVPQNRSW